MKTKQLSSRRLVLFSLIMLLILVILAPSCQQSRGFVLPEGDVMAGKQAFQNLNCDNCHHIADIKWTGNADINDPDIQLGGAVSSIKTYGELVTSVINPSHKISQAAMNDQELTLPDGSSKMERYSYNYVMTVQELVDIVTFLQAEYSLVTPRKTYPY